MEQCGLGTDGAGHIRVPNGEGKSGTWSYMALLQRSQITFDREKPAALREEKAEA